MFYKHHSSFKLYFSLSCFCQVQLIRNDVAMCEPGTLWRLYMAYVNCEQDLEIFPKNL